VEGERKPPKGKGKVGFNKPTFPFLGRKGGSKEGFTPGEK